MQQSDLDSRNGRGGSPNRPRAIGVNRPYLGSASAFALYEVLMGVAIFALGVLALGRAVENCMDASALNAEENRVHLLLSNRMAEVQTTPGLPDEKKEFNVDTGYGVVKLIQTSADAGLKEGNGAQISGLHRVTLSARWIRAGTAQSEQIEFYVYRPG